ncbi:MAG: hypothetical protein ABSE76_03640 [Minisyncoccia bacterium]
MSVRLPMAIHTTTTAIPGTTTPTLGKSQAAILIPISMITTVVVVTQVAIPHRQHQPVH